MRTSESLSDFAPAFAKAQAEIDAASKDGKATVTPSSGRGGYQYRYMTLAACVDAARPALAKHGLSVLQAASTPVTGEPIATVTTRVLHVSGQWVESDLSLPVAKWDAQGIGSALTYARRYGYCALVGVVGDEDDDGAASARQQQPRAAFQRALGGPTGQQQASEPAAPTVAPAPDAIMNGTELPPESTLTQPEQHKLWAVAKAAGWTPSEYEHFLRDEYRVTSSRELLHSQIASIMTVLQAGKEKSETAP